MTRYKVVLLPFPFDDLSSSRVRPAVCLTDPVGPFRHVVVAFVTHRRPHPPLPSDLFLDSGKEGFFETGLQGSSTVQLHRLMTVQTALIRRELGRLTPPMEEQVRQRLQELFGTG